jgi:hypothetical protein
MSIDAEIVVPFAHRPRAASPRGVEVGAVLSVIVVLNIAAAGGALAGWSPPFLESDVNWLITFNLLDVYANYNLTTTALACAQIGLLALWCGAGIGRRATRWLALASGILVWSIALEWLHPKVAIAADTRAIFVLEAATILLALSAVRLLRKSEPQADASRASRQWTLKHLFWITAIAGLGLATSRFLQPNEYSSRVTWSFSFWRAAVAVACAGISLTAYWASRRPWRRILVAWALWFLAGSGLAYSFATFEILWPPAHNPGEAHYAEVFWPFCRAYTTWAVVQGTFAWGVLAMAPLSRSRTEPADDVPFAGQPVHHSPSGRFIQRNLGDSMRAPRLRPGPAT